MTAPRCEPPPEHRGVRWHWLVRERTSGMRSQPKPFPADFQSTGRADIEPLWILPGIGGGATPEWAYEIGYRYLAPAIPPEAKG